MGMMNAMMRRYQAIFFVLAVIAGNALCTAPAFAHRFEVSLVIPPSSAGREIRDGFMLATTERDSHPEEESDGHLGGLDVYVTVIAVEGEKVVSNLGPADIIVAFGSSETLSRIGGKLEDLGAVLLKPGVSPFDQSAEPGVVAFVTAYEKTYGVPPTARAADGYNAARRIDQAVRPLDGTEDRAALRKSFSSTARNFTW